MPSEFRFSIKESAFQIPTKKRLPVSDKRVRLPNATSEKVGIIETSLMRNVVFERRGDDQLVRAERSILVSRWMDMNDRDEEIRTLIWRLGLLDAKFSYRSLGYTKVGVGEYQDVAEFAYLFSGHVREFLIELSFPDYNYVEGFLLRDAMAIRYWIGQRWVRLGQTWHAPLCAKYKFEPRSGDGNFVDLPYEFSVVFDQ